MYGLGGIPSREEFSRTMRGKVRMQPATQETLQAAEDYEKSVAATGDLQFQAASAVRKEFPSWIPGIQAMYALRNGSYELQLYPTPRTVDTREPVMFEGWEGAFMDFVAVNPKYNYKVEFYKGVVHPATNAPSESFCLVNDGLLNLPSVDIIQSLARHVRDLAKICPSVPDAVRRAL